jgi:hypothetical protein
MAADGQGLVDLGRPGRSDRADPTDRTKRPQFEPDGHGSTPDEHGIATG